MLKPGQLRDLPDSIVRLFMELDDFIIADIARRIGKTGRITDTTELELEIAKELKTPLSKIEKKIKDTTDLAAEELEAILKSETIKGLDFDDEIYKAAGMDPSKLYASGMITDILNEGITQTKGDLYNFTQSLGFAVERNGKVEFKPIAEFYQDSLDEALMKVRTGATSYQTATRQAVSKMANSGISFVDYKTGHINRLDVAIRRAIVTGANQMNMQMTSAIMGELGAEYVETSAHMGARPSHAEWQGQVFHIGGMKDGYSDFEQATGYGTGAGLGGWNCRHSYFPYLPGISTRTYTDEQLKDIDPPPFEYLGEKYTYYEATQAQRIMETNMRKTKRKIIGHDAAGDKQAFQNMSIKLNQQKKAYREFSNAAGLRYQLERAGIEGYGKNIAQKASWRARRVADSNIGTNKNPLVTLKKAYSKGTENIEKFAQDVLDSYAIPLKVNMKPLSRGWGNCGTRINDGTLKITSYNLNSEDSRSLLYRMKTAFHETFHAKGGGVKLDIADFEKWRYIEEVFAESTAHYMMRQLGLTTKLSPSYSEYLINVLPLLKRLDYYKDCKYIYDFGKIGYKYRFIENEKTNWLNLYSYVKSQSFDWMKYAEKYIGYISRNKNDILDTFLQNAPRYESVRSNLLADIDNVLKKYNNKGKSGIKLTQNEKVIFQEILINAMYRKGIL